MTSLIYAHKQHILPTLTCAASARSSQFRQVTVREIATPAQGLGSRFSNRYFPHNNRTRDPKM